MPKEQNSIWIDVTTFFIAFGTGGARPTGIPRVVAECMIQAQSDEELRGRIRFCRSSWAHLAIREVNWTEIDRVLKNSKRQAQPKPTVRDRVRQSFPPATVDRLYRLKIAYSQKASQVTKSLRAFDNASGIVHPFKSGDIHINLGCWWHENLPRLIRDIKASGVSLIAAPLVHDCIPLAFPEFFSKQEQRLWREGLEDFEATTDIALANSKNTGGDVMRFMPAIADKVRVVQLGDTFRHADDAMSVEAVRDRFAISQNYVLIVGTIEVRKNHVLALRAWRQMINEGLQPPQLVFGGKKGWKVTDLMEEINDSNGLGGYLKIVDTPSDRQLDALYRGALFTVFPSQYEGWGLPVRESLSYGKICIAARNSAIIEAGDGLAVEFENNCQGDLVRAVKYYLDEQVRASKEAEIREIFHEVPWRQTWLDIKQAISAYL